MPQITKRLVESAEVRDKDHIIFDSEIPGFGLVSRRSPESTTTPLPT